MPHGRLTPLGKQLASVLANLRPAAPCRAFQRAAHTPCRVTSDSTAWARARRSPIGARVRGSAQIRWQSAVATQPQYEKDERDVDAPYQPFQGEWTNEDEYGVGRLAGIDRELYSKPVSNEISNIQWPDLLVNIEQLDETVDYVSNSRRSLLRGKDYPMYHRKTNPTDQCRLEEILYRCIERGAMVKDDSASMQSLELSQEEKEMLQSRSYSASTLAFWADILMNKDLQQTVLRLKDIQDRETTTAVPLYILFHVLRRPHINARTLRSLLGTCFRSLEWHNSLQSGETIDKEDVFTLFTLLLRRVRDVWPAAMPSLVEMLMRYLPQGQLRGNRDSGDDNILISRPDESTHEKADQCGGELSDLSFRLNKAMRLLAIPTSMNPFKAMPIQEQCVITILRFLTDHDPVLDVNRDGFRAVILIQLAHPKSANDRLWAELKTLSWPPWKEDRTAMDADTTAENEGRSKAAETLERMREAGYAPHEWEEVAGIYTGWDADGTPGIQTRVMFSSGKSRFETGAAAWCARIQTTRTVQEAWACYLAYEDQCTTPDQDVCKIMFRKLREEELRTRNTRKYQHFRSLRLDKEIWPGDALEIEPPPPSVHQHTYTRTTPPSFEAFYDLLKEKGVVFEAHCLAFIVSNAPTLKLGLLYMAASESIYPGIRGLFSDPNNGGKSDVPDVVFAAFMELLGRFSNFSLSYHLPKELERLRNTFTTPFRSTNMLIDADRALIHAVMLLKSRLPLYRPAWHSIIRSLGKSSSHARLGIFPREGKQWNSIYTRPKGKGLKQSVEDYRIAFIAFELIRQLLLDMARNNIEVDSTTFLALCNAFENWALRCWLELRRRKISGAEIDLPMAEVAHMLKRDARPSRVVRGCFMNMVGSERSDAAGNEEDAKQLPRLLEVPTPAVLHAFVRVTGWIGDYLGLLDIVQWMIKYEPELRERRELDMNANVMMRRVITALRVFLERTWLLDGLRSPTFEDKDNKKRSESKKGDAYTLALGPRLHKLQTPAPEDTTAEIKQLVESMGDWGGWATDEEVEEYCKHYRFQQFRNT